MQNKIKKIIVFLGKYILFLATLKDFINFKNKIKKGSRDFDISLKNIYPCIGDKTSTTGFESHYIYHTSWAARKVNEINPKKHVDISSSLYFSGIVSAFTPIDFYDYRPAKINLSNLDSKKGDLMELPFKNDSVSSISCMHTIEHIGLGRYGDPIDPEGDLKAIKELERVVKPGGHIIFVTPVGKPKIRFNAHRIYSYKQILSYFKNSDLVEFSLFSEKKDAFLTNADPKISAEEDFGCGCFLFIKK
jgi:SAM-dependent methyltransferase